LRNRRPSELLRYGLLSLPLLFVCCFLLVPVCLTFVISFWERRGFSLRPAFSFAAYVTFFSGIRLEVLQISLLLAIIVMLLGLLLAYPVSYFLANRVGSRAGQTWLFLLSVPFVINPVIRNFALAYILGRSGPVNQMVLILGLAGRPLDWLLFSNFAVVLGLVLSYMPFMIYPLWLSLASIDRRLIEASWMLGVPPGQTFCNVTLPLSLPGIFAAAIFGFVGTFGESTVPIILGGLGYQLMGNTITSALDVLNYPLAAAMSSVVTVSMVAFLLLWYWLFDIRAFMGKIVQG
jgi:ABC-type spermidine/putrescine transport system permease subunit I